MKHKQPTTDELMDQQAANPAPARMSSEERDFREVVVRIVARLDALTSATWAVAHQQNHMINRLSVPEELLKACPWCKK